MNTQCISKYLGQNCAYPKENQQKAVMAFTSEEIEDVHLDFKRSKLNSPVFHLNLFMCPHNFYFVGQI